MNIEKFTLNAGKRIAEAQSSANIKKHSEILSEHLLDAMLSGEDSLAAEVLSGLGVDLGLMRARVTQNLQKISTLEGAQLGMSHELSSVLSEAERISSSMKDSYITEEHLLLGLIQNAASLEEIFASFYVTKKSVEETIKTMRNGESVTDNDPENKMNTLKKYGVDLIELAENDKIDPVIGREEEIRRTLQILSRKTKNNPVLV